MELDETIGDILSIINDIECNILLKVCDEVLDQICKVLLIADISYHLHVTQLEDFTLQHEVELVDCFNAIAEIDAIKALATCAM